MLTKQETVKFEQIRKDLLSDMRAVPPEGKLVTYAGRKFILRTNVFWMPENTVLLEKWIIRPGDDVLDVGTGSGLIAVVAAAKGAKRVLAIDINPAAVACAKENAALNGFENRIEVRQSDVFAAIGNEQFDVITANLPFEKRHAKDVVETSIYDTVLYTNRRFFAEAGRHLKPGGRIYFYHANFGAVEEVLKLAEKAGFSVRLLGEKRMPQPDPRIFYVFEMRKKTN